MEVWKSVKSDWKCTVTGLVIFNFFVGGGGGRGACNFQNLWGGT